MPLLAAGLVIFRVLNQKVEYLMLQTSYGRHHWTPPKGHVDPGEEKDILRTAQRETEEEAGLSARDYRVVEDFQRELHYTVKDNQPKRVVYWLAQLRDPNTAVKLSEEHQNLNWGDLEDTLKLCPSHQDMQKVFLEADSFIKKNILKE